MKKVYIPLLAILFFSMRLSAQKPPNGTLDDVTDFSTKITVPFIMPDGVKLMTDIYVPRLRDSMRLSLGTVNVGFGPMVTDTITFIPLGAQIIYYDSINGQPNPDPYQLPTIFTRTPYNKGDWDELGSVLPMLGYNYVLQDMRGRYASEGVYFPMYSDSWNKNPYHANPHILDYLPSTDPKASNKHEDGYNSIKVIESLEIPHLYDSLPHTNERFNNGSIGMFGASALANTQLQAGAAHRIKDSIPALKCLLPVVGTTEHYISTGYNNGVFRNRIVTGWLKGQIFSGTDDDLIPVDNDRQNSIHSSADYDLPKTITVNGVTRTYEQNKFEAANLCIDHFSAMRYHKLDGTLSNAGFYPNSVGRGDMDASQAPVSPNGEAVDAIGEHPLPNLNTNRYTNMDVPILYVSGWWDIFTEGEINNHWMTMKNLTSDNKYMQKIIIGPWAHQTVASRISGDRFYAKNVTDITKIDLTNFSLSNVPLNDILQSDLITWFRYNLNYNSDKYVGEPKFIIRASNNWQHLGNAGSTFGDVYVRVPSEDYIVSFVDMMNFLAGKGGLQNLKIELHLPAVGQTLTTTQSLPSTGAILPAFGGDTAKLIGIPRTDFRHDVANVRYYVVGPDSAADAAAGYPQNATMGNYWGSCDQFPPSDHITWKHMYLHQDGSFNETAPVTDEGYKLYVDDPDDPIMTVGGSNMIVRSPDGTRNSQSQMELTDPANAPYTMDREGVIQFNSATIADSFSIVGLPVCTLYAKTNPGGVASGPTDTDWDMRICDVWPDGRVYFVQEGIVSGRSRDWGRALVDSMGVPGAATYANGIEDPGDKDLPYSNIEIGQIYEYVFKMMPIAYTFATGHKIRVLINSTNYTRYQPNPNLPINDGEFFRRNPGDGQEYTYNGTLMSPRVAVQRVHFSTDHPTNINFPMYDKNFIYNDIKQVAVDSKFDINVFPNPASDKIQIFVNQPGDHEVVITDITGRTVTTGRFDDNIIFNTETFGKGIYFATVTDLKSKTNHATSKFIVQ